MKVEMNEATILAMQELLFYSINYYLNYTISKIQLNRGPNLKVEHFCSTFKDFNLKVIIDSEYMYI